MASAGLALPELMERAAMALNYMKATAAMTTTEETTSSKPLNARELGMISSWPRRHAEIGARDHSAPWTIQNGRVRKKTRGA